MSTSVTADDVRAALDDVHDPCSEAAGVPAGLVEMGLVRALDVDPSPDGVVVRVAIGVTEPTCLMGPSLATGARRRLEAMPGVARVDVTLSDDPDWAPSDMSPEYQARLAEHRAAKRAALGITDIAQTRQGTPVRVGPPRRQVEGGV
jgi:metal-sulfur cluster biosynthetic enzyme